MAAETANYGLKKPGAEDFYNIEDFNWNADVIDAELAKRAELGEDGKVPAAQLPIFIRKSCMDMQINPSLHPGNVTGQRDQLIFPL